MFSNSGLWIRVTLLFLFVVSSWAIMITSPDEGAVWSSTGEHTVSWIEVDTDPETFAISLVQLGVFKQILVPTVDGTKGSVTFSAALPTGTGFQVNIIRSASQPDSILAQSPQITITSSGPSSTSSGNTPLSTSSLSSSSTTSSSTTSATPNSSNGTPGGTSGSSITSPTNSPTSSPGVAPSNDGPSSGSAANGPSSTLSSASPPSAAVPIVAPSVTNSATSSSSNSTFNAGPTSSLVSLEPTSNEATSLLVGNTICFALLLSNIWTLL